jgi:peptide/nickel transport system permease protein
VGALMGSFFIEFIFTYPGVGTLFLTAVGQHDFSVVVALILMFSVLTAVGMLISDILLMIVDPRIRVE